MEERVIDDSIRATFLDVVKFTASAPCGRQRKIAGDGVRQQDASTGNFILYCAVETGRVGSRRHRAIERPGQGDGASPVDPLAQSVRQHMMRLRYVNVCEASK